MANHKVPIEREQCQTRLSNVEREEVRPKGNPDEYYNRPEVSNSDLTELKNLLHPRMQFGDKEAAFRFGTLVDAIITEPARVNYYQFTVDDVQYTEEEFYHARQMNAALRSEAKRDPFLAKVLELADTQRFMVNKQQRFEYGGFPFHLDTRCKWDWFLSDFNFGGDLKTTFASTQKEFEEALKKRNKIVANLPELKDTFLTTSGFDFEEYKIIIPFFFVFYCL